MELIIVIGSNQFDLNEIIRLQAEETCQILVLNEKTASELDRCAIGYKFIEDFIDKNDAVGIFLRAQQLEQIFLATVERILSANEFKLLILDKPNLQWFWFEAATCERFAELNKLKSYSKIHLFSSYTSRAASYYAENNASALIINSLLSDVLAVNLYKKSRLKSFFRKTHLALRGYYSLIKNFHLVYILSKTQVSLLEYFKNRSKPRILVFLNTIEYNRFKKFLFELKDDFRIKLILTRPKFSNLQVHISYIRFYFKFSEFWVKFISGIENEHEKKIFNAIRPTILSVYSNRLPHLFHHFEKYLDRISKLEPDLILGSSLMDAESQLPILAGIELNKSCVSIPHSHIYRNNKLPLVNYTLVQHKYQWMITRAIQNKSVALSCANILPDFLFADQDKDLIKIHKNSRNLEENKLTVMLIGLDETFTNGLFIYNLQRTFRNIVDDLKEIKNNYNSGLEFIFRPHPTEFENSSFLNYVKDQGFTISDTTISFFEYSEIVDCVVVFDNIQSVLMQSISLKKPTFFVKSTKEFLHTKRVALFDDLIDFTNVYNLEILEFEELLEILKIKDPSLIKHHSRTINDQRFLADIELLSAKTPASMLLKLLKRDFCDIGVFR